MTSLAALLAVAASALAGHHVAVQCRPTPPPLVGVAYTASLVRLRPDYCAHIADLVAGDDRDPFWQATAVLILAHEAAHASRQPRWHDETWTECRAIRLFPRALALLGADAALASLAPLAQQAHDGIRAAWPAYSTVDCSVVDAADAGTPR